MRAFSGQKEDGLCRKMELEGSDGTRDVELSPTYVGDGFVCGLSREHDVSCENEGRVLMRVSTAH
ncbi:hypothetical protein C8R48DRAFT_723533 [Suillus tomentosus]|nr:hypothetical protein C8R48DRAFT_723533 [Suillus tomentosus]